MSPGFVRNALPEYREPLVASDRALLGRDAADLARERLARHARVEATPLHALAALAESLGIASIHAKDESTRLGLGAFKALGGAYAVLELADETGPQVTVACASAGNHGRSVAWGASLVGARSVIFVHQGVSESRAAAIAAYGARIVRVAGTYDDSVAECERISAREGWVVVSDTSVGGDARFPRLVMQGYTVLVDEALRELHARNAPPPTHVFMQAGVGGLAAAVAGHLAERYGVSRPTFIVVEPARAACVLASAHAGAPVQIESGAPTIMAMLECYAPSHAAWPILARAADAFMTVDESDAVAMMRRLAVPLGNDPTIVAGESGGVGLAGVSRAATESALRASLALDADSRVLVVISEGATDPRRYEELVTGSLLP